MKEDNFNSIKESIRKHGTLVRGKKELLAYLDGKRLNARQKRTKRRIVLPMP